VSIAIIQYDNETHKDLQFIHALIKPEGYTEMPKGAYDIHGISYEDTVAHGECFLKVYKILHTFLKQTKTVVGHNVEFDLNVIKSEAFRRGLPVDTLETVVPVCTLKMVKNIYNKPMRLEAIYFHLFNDTFKTHNALTDTLACAKVYQALLKHTEPESTPINAKCVIIKASEVAACIGQHPFKKTHEVMDDMWKQNSPETFRGCTRKDRAQAILQKSECAQSIFTDAVSVKPTNSDDAEAVFKNAAEKIAANTDLSRTEKSEVLDHIRSKVYTQFGTRSEDTTSDKVESEDGVRLVRDDKFYTLDVTTIHGTVYSIVGRVDRIEERPDGSRVLVEIKNRTRCLFNEVRGYEMIQVQTYLQLLGLKTARLVEQYNNQMNSNTIERDDTTWNSMILPKLVEFCERLHRNMSGESK
jgi:DNA polymerase III epsilon subunit-like protein